MMVLVTYVLSEIHVRVYNGRHTSREGRNIFREKDGAFRAHKAIEKESGGFLVGGSPCSSLRDQKDSSLL
jgi:hypothetical protein